MRGVAGVLVLRGCVRLGDYYFVSSSCRASDLMGLRGGEEDVKEGGAFHENSLSVYE